MGDDDVLNQDRADAHSEQDDSDYDNNVDESGDEAPFLDESDKEEPHFIYESNNEQPD